MHVENGAPRFCTFISTTYDRVPDTSRVERSADVAIERLTSRGVNREQLLNWVAVIMISSRKPLYAGDWALDSGQSARSLKELAGRTRTWADEVEQVNNFRSNGVPLLDPERFVAADWSTKCLAVFFPDHSSNLPGMGLILKRLPDLLRAYGAYLGAQISEISAHVADLERVSTVEPDLTALLCEFVHQSTHGEHYCYEQLADVLTAAYQIDGRDRTASAGALRMNRDRYLTSNRTPKVRGFELEENQRLLRVLVEIEAPAIPS